MIKNILTFLRIDYRDVLLIALYFVVLGISIPKIRTVELLYHIKFFCKNSKKSICLQWKYRHSGNDYRVAKLSKSYLTTT